MRVETLEPRSRVGTLDPAFSKLLRFLIISKTVSYFDVNKFFWET
jgi:hypothetical protein